MNHQAFDFYTRVRFTASARDDDKLERPWIIDGAEVGYGGSFEDEDGRGKLGGTVLRLVFFFFFSDLWTLSRDWDLELIRENEKWNDISMKG